MHAIVCDPVGCARDRRRSEMKTNEYNHVRFFLVTCILFSLAMLVACKPRLNNPFPNLKEWDLLIISDSSNWGVGQYYAKLIEKDMHVKVNLHDCLVGSMSIGSALNALQGGTYLMPFTMDPSCFRPWKDLIKEAEVMVLAGNYLDSAPSDGSWDDPENINVCLTNGYEGRKSQLGFDTYEEKILQSCDPDTFTTYKAHLGAMIDEIYKIREGRPIILRMTNIYIPYHSSWKEWEVDDTCTKCVVTSLKTIQQVAEEHGVPLANTLVAFNGEDYLLDPVDTGYIRVDGTHLSDKGAQLAAFVLQKTGYECTGK